jgi:hypothetical protein
VARHVVKLAVKRGLKVRPAGLGVDVLGIRAAEDDRATGAEVRAVKREGSIDLVRPKLIPRRRAAAGVLKEEVVAVEFSSRGREVGREPLVKLDEARRSPSLNRAPRIAWKSMSPRAWVSGNATAP